MKETTEERRKYLVDFARRIFNGHTQNQLEEIRNRESEDGEYLDFDKTKARLQIAITPNNPHTTLISPGSLKYEIPDLAVESNGGTFPPYNWAFETDPKGLQHLLI